MSENSSSSRKRPWLTYLALVLWLGTTSLGAYYFVFGKTIDTVDERIAVKLSAEERNFILEEMRSLVVGLHGIMDGLAKEDSDQIAQNLSNMGMKMAADDSKALLGKLPLGLKTMGMGLHRKMDVLAEQVRKNELSDKELFAELSLSLGTCVACHASYKVVVDTPSGKH